MITVSPTAHISSFASDVLAGLQQRPRRLSSKYFYDEKGDALFQQIMHMPEYYLTDSEREIFAKQSDDIRLALSGQAFELVELGAGDGSKTKLLLANFLAVGIDFHYRPIDISQNVLDQLHANLKEELPGLNISLEQGDYLLALDRIFTSSEVPKVIFFLGANIGNFNRGEATAFIRQLAERMRPKDRLFIGFDLKKDPQLILDAYNDAAGVTAAFNLNLLHRINRELGANFAVDHWRHWETYDPISGAAKSHLVSTQDQEVFIQELNQSFYFPAWDVIHTEVSWKYSLADIESLASASGFEIEANFMDERSYFVDSLWRLE